MRENNASQTTNSTELCLSALSHGLAFSKKGSVSKQILSGRRWRHLPPRRRRVLAGAFERRLRFFKYRGLVRERVIGERLVLELTDGGRVRLFRAQMRHAPPLPSGTHVRVEYDFPEKQRKVRNAFRYFLKTSGFVRFQQSIWLCSRDVYELLCSFVRQHDLGDWVDVIVGKPADVPRRRLVI